VFKVKGERRTMFGTVCTVLADNLGSQALGGFKESCSAYRMCRQCMATHDTATAKVPTDNTC
jgi:hypothetical protein